MPKVTQLPFISSGTTSTSFLVVDANYARRLQYDDFVTRVVSDVQLSDFRGPTGPAGPASTIAGPSGPSGPAGTNGIGIPVGGTTGQSLIKSSNSNYAVSWGTVTGAPGDPGPAGIGVPAGGSSGQILSKVSGNDYETAWINNSSIGLTSRTASTGTVTSLGSGSSNSLNILGYKTYMLSKVVTDYPAWVRIYADSASRTSDASRSSGTDPLPGSGVIAEVITTPGNLTQLITPGVTGFNNDNPTSSTVYISVTNNDTVTRTINVTLTLLQLES